MAEVEFVVDFVFVVVVVVVGVDDCFCYFPATQ